MIKSEGGETTVKSLPEQRSKIRKVLFVHLIALRFSLFTDLIAKFGNDIYANET